MEPPGPHPTRKLAIENERLRLRIEALERGRRYALMVPMQVADRVVGTLSLWSAERPYSRADEEFVVSVAALLALRLSRSGGR